MTSWIKVNEENGEQRACREALTLGAGKACIYDFDISDCKTTEICDITNEPNEDKCRSIPTSSPSAIYCDYIEGSSTCTSFSLCEEADSPSEENCRKINSKSFKNYMCI